MTEVITRYPPAVLAGDYLRAGIGLAVTAGPLALLPLHPWVAVPMAAVALLFVVFLAGTVRRHLTRYRIDETGIVADGPLGAGVRWGEVDRVGLRYFSTRRDRGGGWMELQIAGSRGRLTVMSTLDRFDRIAERTATAACQRGLVLSPVTIENFAALGIALDVQAPAEQDAEQDVSISSGR